ncbi:MAG: ABC transporter permease, partial [Nitriliruptoraceae bacterium]
MEWRPFLRFAGARAGAFVLLGLGVTLLSFIITNLVPGDPMAAALSDRALEDEATVAAYRARYGLDEPLPMQYLIYLGNL